MPLNPVLVPVLDALVDPDQVDALARNSAGSSSVHRQPSLQRGIVMQQAVERPAGVRQRKPDGAAAGDRHIAYVFFTNGP